MILAASICTRGGKPVLSRQFVETSRSRVEGLLASLPKFTNIGTQHTTIETDTVRYVYQPLDELYMVLMTNKHSNILQDIETLHLFAQVVTNMTRSNDESDIQRNAFELLDAFDEIVSLGYKENVTLPQIRSNLEMESHEEKIQEIISRNKEFEASEERKRKAKQLEMQRREMNRESSRHISGGSSYQPLPRTSYAVEQPPEIPKAESPMYTSQRPLPKGKGMQLGKKSKAENILEVVGTEVAIPESPPTKSMPTMASPESPIVHNESDGVLIQITEALSAKATRDGDLEAFDIKGDLSLLITDPSLTKINLKVITAEDYGPQLKLHPNIDKAVFAKSKTIALKVPGKPFPLNQSIQILRWRLPAKQLNIPMPLSITCWPSESNEGCDVTLEYELTDDLKSLSDVVIGVPIPAGTIPNVSDYSGDYAIEDDNLLWKLPSISSENPSGSLSFSSETDDTNTFFPLTVHFSVSRPFCQVDVSTIKLTELDQSVPFKRSMNVTVDSYTVA